MKKLKTRKKGNKIRPAEFLETMKRVELIDQEIKQEEKLFNIKIKSLELEKEYLWNKIQAKKK